MRKTLKAVLFAANLLLMPAAHAAAGDLPAYTQVTAARAAYDAGWALAWAGDRARAAQKFRDAQHADPACAMCFWAEAWAAPEREEAAAPLHAARVLAPRFGAHVMELVAALEQRVEGKFAEALLSALARFPATSTALLAADALLGEGSNADAHDQARALLAQVLGLDGAVPPLDPEAAPAIDPAPLHAGARHLWLCFIEAGR